MRQVREAQAYFFRPRGQQLLQARGDTLARVSRGFVSPLDHRHGYRISLRSVTEPIDDTSTGKLMEGVLASFAQFDNDVRSDRTRAGMKGALELGRWTFRAPMGYINVPRTYGKSPNILWFGL